MVFALALAFSVPGRAMAWRSSGATNDELVDNLRTNGVIEHADVAAAMKAVDRGFYVVKGTGNPYVDSPQGIGFGATISAPHMHAHCLEVLRPWLKPGARVLDVGSGTGYLTALFAQFVGEKGLVESYEARPHHLAQAERNVRAFWQVENVRFHLGKLEEAELEEAAYDGVALDLMEPWKALEKAALALKPDRFLVAYLPNITQVLELVRAAEAHPFRLERVLEVGWREWEVRLPVAHPRFQQVGHTAFLVALRRWKAS